MEKEDLELLQELMEKLSGEMQPSKDDIMERLGKGKKPEVEMLNMESEEPSVMDVDDDSPVHFELESPKMKLKKRLMKTRG